ncbi:MAG TPA: transposase [Tepidisphaeraceae bacterium]|nr:transposase [Tepidisphaeraceae bacterium]
MARQTRSAADDGIYHVFNRGNCRMDIFTKPGDFAAFIKLLEEGRRRTDMRILAYCLMDNHWHLVVWPKRGRDLSRFMQWVGTTHVRRWREHRGNAGEGHLYQGRFKGFMIEADEHLLTVLRYVEGNRVRSGLVKRAQDWPWSSLAGQAGADGVRVQLCQWPVERPRNWAGVVNEVIESKTLGELQTSLARGRPFGSAEWVGKMAARHGLERTLRDPWRPKKSLVPTERPKTRKRD